MTTFRFEAPWFLALIPVVLAAAWLLHRRRRSHSARLAVPGGALRARLAATGWVRIERTLPWLRGVALCLVVVALARPQSGASETTVSTYGVDIVVALDASGSMRAEDFRPLNRLAVAKRTVAEFVEKRPDDRIGLVVFAGLATTRCPLTLDHVMLRQFLDEVQFPSQEEDGTAIGMGLATAVARLKASPARSKVIVLVTDGRNNRGQIGPDTATEMAKALGIRVYTVGVGTEGEAPVPIDTPLGRRYVYQQLDLDEGLLKSVAERCGGRFFRAQDADGLRQVFESINALEKTRQESRQRILYTERFALALLPAALVFGFERLLARTRLRRIP
jgi:Ca-activated chloride channel family protein